MFAELLGVVSGAVGGATRLATGTIEGAVGLATSTLDDFGEFLDTLTGQERRRAIVVLHRYESGEITRGQAAKKLLRIAGEEG